MGKKSKKEEPETLPYYTVIQDEHGALICDCPNFNKNGKPCLDILVVRLQQQYGPVQQYIDVETRTDRGKNAKGVFRVPPKSRSSGRSQARSDYTVDAEYDSYLAKVERGWDPHRGTGLNLNYSDVNGEPDKSNDLQRDKIDPFAIGTQLTQGRPPNIAPLHPGRSLTFSAKKGPKPKPHGSLLPAFKLTDADEGLVQRVTGPDIPLSHLPSQNPDVPTVSTTAAEAPIPKILAKDRTHLPDPIYTPEEIEMFDIDLDRWDNPSYTLRADEMSGIVELLNALLRCTRPAGRSALVFSNSYHSQAESLRKLKKWDKKCETNLFPIGSVLHRAWTQNQDLEALDACLFFHHDPVHDHWLLFVNVLSTEKIFCIDPMSTHEEKSVDVQDMRVVSSYFTPENYKKPRRGINHHYQARPAGVQQDGSSCGFWTITLALLWICNVPIARRDSQRNMRILRDMGITRIKSYWKAIWTSWRIDEAGLTTAPLLDLMSNWDMEFESVPIDDCIAPRPSWIPRFDPEEARLNITKAQDAVVKQTHPESDSLPRPQMTGKTFAEAAQAEWGSISAALQENKKILDQIRSQNIHFIIEGGRNPVGADDLKRLCTCEGMVNDALVNYIVDMCHLKPLAFSDAVKIPPPTTESVSQDLVTSTFLWPKLQDASNAARAGDEESFRKQYEHIACWYSDIDFKNIRKVFIPIHQKAAHHWLLVKIHLVKSLIYIYDSWLPNQKNHARRLAESDNGMLADYAEIVHAVEYWWEMLTVRDGLPFPDWSKWLKAPSLQAIPHQLNGVDCGLFIIYFILYLQRWTTLHSPQIPAHLRFTGAGENMDYRRVLLFKLILQVGSPIAASSQRLASPASPPIIVDDPTGPLASPIVLVPRTVKAAPESDDFESDIEITSAFIEEVAEDEDMPESILAIEEEESLQNPNGKHTASRQDMVAPEQDVMMTPPSTSPLPTLTPTPPRLRRSTRKQKFK